MSDYNGALSIAAFQKGEKQSAYGDAESLGANDQLPYISADIGGDRSNMMPAIIDGSYGRQTSFQTGVKFAGNLVAPLFYEGGIEDLIAFALGYENPNDDDQEGSPHNYATGVYKHVFECDNTVERYGWTSGEDRLPSGSGGGTWTAADKKVRSFTLGFAKQVSDTRYVDAIINSLTLTGDTEKVEATFDLVAQTEGRSDYSSDTWTLRSNLQNNYDNLIVKPTQLAVKISGTTIYVTSWEIILENTLSAEDRTADSQTILEPNRNDFIKCTFKFELPRYINDTYLSKKFSGSAEYASIEYTGPQIGATGKYYTFGLYLPVIDFYDGETPNVSGPGLSNLIIAGEAKRCAPADVPAAWLTAVTQLEDITLIKNGPLIVMAQNGRSGNVFDEY